MARLTRLGLAVALLLVGSAVTFGMDRPGRGERPYQAEPATARKSRAETPDEIRDPQNPPPRVGERPALDRGHRPGARSRQLAPGLALRPTARDPDGSPGRSASSTSCFCSGSTTDWWRSSSSWWGSRSSARFSRASSRAGPRRRSRCLPRSAAWSLRLSSSSRSTRALRVRERRAVAGPASRSPTS